MRVLSWAMAVLAGCGAQSAGAEVTAATDAGFASHNQVEIAVSPEAAWQAMLQPGLWWNGEHTYSGSSANMSLDAVPGGCFCETIPAAGGARAGAIEHMRVIYIAPGSALRLTGGLGPLQPEAVTGVLTMTVEPAGEGAKIAWDYVVGGYMRMSMTELAPLVDQVMAEQLGRLGSHLASGSAADR
jgi:hypothetical protein